MAEKTTCMIVHVSLMIITILLTSSTAAIADDTTPIPSKSSQVGNWFYKNVKPYNERRSALDPALVAAEHAPKIIKVMQDGKGNFKTITDAINSIPAGNTKRVTVYIEGGVYKEKVTIPNNKPFVTFYGSLKHMPNITFDGTAHRYGTVYSGTLTVESDYFRAANLVIIVPLEPDGIREGARAVALQISGNKAAFYKCKMFGFQDTLYDYKGLHLFKDCFIQGTVDFIFGKGKSLYLNTQIHVIECNLTIITAQQRDTSSEDSGFSFVHCKITGTTYVRRTYLGRAWGSSPNVVLAYTDMADIVHPEWWSDFGHPERESKLFYGDYNNWGKGSNITSQTRYIRKLSDAEAKPFISLGYIQGSKWLLPNKSYRSRHSSIV